MSANTQVAPSEVNRDVLQELKELLVKDLDINLKMEQLHDDVPLLEEGLALDSVVLAELITVVESHFDFQFDDQDMNTDTFSNLSNLAQFIAAQRKAA